MVEGERARTKVWTQLLRCITLHCTWRPRALTTELHGQVSQRLSSGTKWRKKIKAELAHLDAPWIRSISDCYYQEEHLIEASEKSHHKGGTVWAMELRGVQSIKRQAWCGVMFVCTVRSPWRRRQVPCSELTAIRACWVQVLWMPKTANCPDRVCCLSCLTCVAYDNANLKTKYLVKCIAVVC